jgi:hypothetical protein
MRKELIGTVSGMAFLLAAIGIVAISGNSSAQQSPTAEPQIPSTDMNKGDRQPGMRAPAANKNDKPSSAGSTGLPQEPAKSYKSYKLHSGSYKGKIVGNHSPDKLMGSDLVNIKGESIAEIEDLLVNRHGVIRLAIVEVGGFLGIGSRTVAVDINRLMPIVDEEKKVRAMMTKDQLERMPEFELKDGTWRQKNESRMK